MDSTVPVWAAALVGLGGAALGAAGAVLASLVTRRGAREAAERSRSDSDRDLLKTALPLLRSDDDASRQQGFELLDALLSTDALHPDDALLVRRMTRHWIRSRLVRAQGLEGTAGSAPTFDLAGDEEGGHP